MLADAGLKTTDNVLGRYRRFHADRIERTMRLLKAFGARRIVEVGGHPWALAERLLAEPGFELLATVSAQEATRWPDDIGVTIEPIELHSPHGGLVRIPNYVTNVERTRFAIEMTPDTVLACEVIEHLVRAPHVMMLNINSWLPVGGRVVLTTPNGCQFMNPFRRRPRMPAYRARIYERHTYVYSLSGLRDLVAKTGFDVESSGFWNAYARSGAAGFYSVLGRIPIDYFREKFTSTLFVVARKRESVDVLRRLPAVCAPSPDWEYVCMPELDGPPDD